MGRNKDINEDINNKENNEELKSSETAEEAVRGESGDDIKENRMGTAPVHGLLVKMSVPLMISMFVQSLYNIVDSIFVSRINEDALTAVSMSFPIQTLMIAVAVGTAVGMSALLSRFLGARMFDRVNNVAENGIFLSWMCFLLFVLIGFGARTFMSFQTDNARIVTYGTQYLHIVCWMSIMVFTQIIFERLLQGTGKTIYIFFMQGTGAIVNIIMDPILIFGLLGAPKLGVAGAAYATVMGQTVGALMGMYFNFKKNKEIHISMKGFRPDFSEIKEIYRIGFPSIVMQSVGSLMVFIMNMILVKFSTTAVATFGAYFKLQSFCFMPVFGMSNGLVPIIAYNYGARKSDRMEQAMSLSVKYSVGMMVVGTVLFWVFPGWLLSLFDASANMTQMGTAALRIISLSFPLAGYTIMRGSVFQALGKSVYGMNISLIRQLCVLLPLAFILSLLGNVNYVWLSFPLAELVGLAAAIRYTKKIRREIIGII